MYARTSFRGAKTCKIGGVVCFWSYWQILERTCTQIKKNVCKNAYLGSIFIPEKYVLGCVLKVLLRGWYPAWNTSTPRDYSKSCFSKKVFPKGHYSKICNFTLTCDFLGVKTVRNNDEPLEYRSTYMSFEGELSKLLARLLLVLLIYV